jgi:hypothetical protein
LPREAPIRVTTVTLVSVRHATGPIILWVGERSEGWPLGSSGDPPDLVVS